MFIFQTYLFMDQRTLSGARKNVYSLLKILKYVMDSKMKSYEAKYAVEMVFRNNNPSGICGEALKEVMSFKTIRGLIDTKSLCVHPDLKKLGVTEIELLDNYVDFKGILRKVKI